MQVRVCVNDEPVGPIPLSVTPGPAFTMPLTLTPSPLAAGDKIVVQLFHPAVAKSPATFGPESSAVIVGSCSMDAPKSAGPGPSLTTTPPILNGSSVTISGTVPASAKGTSVRVCVNDLQVGQPQAVDSTTTTPTFKITGVKLSAGQIVTAQVVNGTSPPFTYGPLSAEVSVGPCSAVGSAQSGSLPTLNKVTDGDKTVTGTLANADSGTVRICENDAEIATAPVAADGTFSATLSAGTAFKQGDSVTAQQIASAPGTFPKSYGLVSAPATEVAASANPADNTAAGLDLTKGNTLFTRSAVALQIASASGAPVNADYALGFFLNAPLYWHDVYWHDVDCTKPKTATTHPDYCPKVIPIECVGPFQKALTCSNSPTPSEDCTQNAQQVASCVPKIQDNEQQRGLRRQFRDPLSAPLWAYGLATLSSIPQTGITVGSLTSPTGAVTNAITTNSSKDITTIVQAFNFEQGLEWNLYRRSPVLPDAFGSIPPGGSSFTKLGLFFYGGYGIGVPVNGVLNPTTYYDLTANPDLYAEYNLPSNIPGKPGYDPTCGLTSTGKKPPPNPNCGVPGANPFKYLALQQVSSVQFFQSYYFGLRLKSFTYDTRPCKSQLPGAGSAGVPLRFCSVPRNVFPGLYDIGIGQDESVTGYRFHGAVLRVQSSYSLPFYTPLHLFGSINYALNPGAAPTVANLVVTPVTNTPATILGTYLQPLPPPVRSRYSFGLSLDVVEVIKKGLQAKIQIASITPTTATYSLSKDLAGGKTIQFYAPVSGSSDTQVNWLVFGPAGSSAAAGTISSSSGVYTPPKQVASTNLVVTVTATAHADTSKSSTLQITLTP